MKKIGKQNVYESAEDTKSKWFFENIDTRFDLKRYKTKIESVFKEGKENPFKEKKKTVKKSK
jgi:hypothetical protein